MSIDERSASVGVTIENISLAFGETEVLKGVNLTIEPGEFFTLLGPSGSGKSTLLRLIAGFGPRPTTGRVLIGDQDVTRLPPWRRNLGMVFQSYALWPHMTVRSNVAFGLEERRIAAKDINQRVDAALDMVGLKDLAERRPSQLSGGQQQRVALARTIVIQPQVLLLDEPLSNLDANLRIQTRREILELQRKLGLTTIFVTHDQEEANTTSDRIAVLNQGIIQQVDSPVELYDHPVNRFVASFLGSANLIDGTVEASDGKLYLRAADGTQILLDGEGIEAGPNRTAIFRPQSISITAPGAANAANAGDGPGLAGTVRHREFLGSLIHYAVAIGQHTVLVEATHQAGTPAFEVGAAVVLGLNPQRIRILSD
ncbi:MAG: ABC transporter ATP-binding protein [Alphaproteobacteria bacterium]